MLDLVCWTPVLVYCKSSVNTSIHIDLPLLVTRLLFQATGLTLKGLSTVQGFGQAANQTQPANYCRYISPAACLEIDQWCQEEFLCFNTHTTTILSPWIVLYYWHEYQLEHDHNRHVHMLTVTEVLPIFYLNPSESCFAGPEGPFSAQLLTIKFYRTQTLSYPINHQSWAPVLDSHDDKCR